MICLKSIYPIGLDIGYDQIYAAQFKPRRKDFIIRGLWHRQIHPDSETTPDSNNALIRALKGVLDCNLFRGKKAVVHMPNQNVFSFPIEFSLEEGEALEEAILREARKVAPFPIEEAIIDYPSIEPVRSNERNHYRAVIIAVRRTDLEKFLLLLREAGLLVEAVETSTSSLIRLHSHLKKNSEETIILCNIGYKESLLSVITKNNILAQRHISWGTQVILRKLLRYFEHLDIEDKARLFLKDYCLINDVKKDCDSSTAPHVAPEMKNTSRSLNQIIMPSIENLIHEFHTFIAYMRSEFSSLTIMKIYMYGDANLIDSLDNHLEKRFNIPTKLVNPITEDVRFNGGIIHDKSEGSPFALALGLAMRKIAWP